MKTTAAYGTWRSLITGDFVAGRSHRAGELQLDGDRLFWLETRPTEQGRQTLLYSESGAPPREILPTPWNARSTVHEYGGASYRACGERVFFVNAADQQVHQLDLATGAIQRLTHTPRCRYADLQWDARHRRLIAISEEHQDGAAPRNRLVAIKLTDPGAIQLLDDQADFFSSPRLSPDGAWLAYLSWNHPHMPWESTRLWRRQVYPDGRLGDARLLAGGDRESVLQPQWSPAGELCWISDQTGWWNLYCEAEPVLELEAEFAPPQWVFGQSHYGFSGPDTLLAACSSDGAWRLLELQRRAGRWHMEPVELGSNQIAQIVCGAGLCAVLDAGPQRLQTLWLKRQGSWQVLREQPHEPLTTADISVGQGLSFRSGDSRAHGFFYPPANARWAPPEGDLPPLIVIGHGGPTSAADPSLNFKIQFWTQRGFAVLDVNYRGSSGYGRAYREALLGQWGVADVADLCAGAEYVTAQGWVHPRKRAIRGSSAGGFSVLCALTDHTIFNAGVSLYGIGDLEALARDTHKFEAHYLDSLVGPYPSARSVYLARSPLHKADRIRCPLLVFQGQEDKVVPPAQAEQMVAALQQTGTPVDYVIYPDEAHGFRRAANIQHQLDTELAFYQRVFHLGGEQQEESP